jgi:hypothetical protein
MHPGLTSKQKILLDDLMDRCYVMCMLCERSTVYYSGIKFFINFTLVIVNSAMTIFNSYFKSCDEQHVYISIFNIVSNVISTVLVAILATFKIMEKCFVFSTMSNKFQKLENQIHLDITNNSITSNEQIANYSNIYDIYCEHITHVFPRWIRRQVRNEFKTVRTLPLCINGIAKDDCYRRKSITIDDSVSIQNTPNSRSGHHHHRRIHGALDYARENGSPSQHHNFLQTYVSQMDFKKKRELIKYLLNNEANRSPTFSADSCPTVIGDYGVSKKQKNNSLDSLSMPGTRLPSSSDEKRSYTFRMEDYPSIRRLSEQHRSNYIELHTVDGLILDSPRTPDVSHHYTPHNINNFDNRIIECSEGGSCTPSNSLATTPKLKKSISMRRHSYSSYRHDSIPDTED